LLWLLIGAASTPWVPKLRLLALFNTQVGAITTWTLNVPVAVVASAPLHAKEQNAINAAAKKYRIRMPSVMNTWSWPLYSARKLA
jgi:hypothetical protein